MRVAPCDRAVAPQLAFCAALVASQRAAITACRHLSKAQSASSAPGVAAPRRTAAAGRRGRASVGPGEATGDRSVDAVAEILVAVEEASASQST
jgi:hypothetical protein